MPDRSRKRPTDPNELAKQLVDVYGYLDPDVAEWLKKNAPRPMHGQNYHQWLSSQYGLKRLTEHLWMLIGVASACHTMNELRQRMAERFGKQQIQLMMFIDPPSGPPQALPPAES